MPKSYREFSIEKRSGGFRKVSAPVPRLLERQTRILRALNARLEPSSIAHGFRAGRSILTNATPHTNAAVVIRMDLDSFFHRIDFHSVRKIMVRHGIGRRKAHAMSLAATRSIDGIRALPQGAPTSPLLSNVSCLALDRVLSLHARHFGFAVTRYADDITFSAQETKKIGQLLSAVSRSIVRLGFRINHNKTTVMFARNRQWVTGVVVNKGTNTSKAFRKRLRAMLHQQGLTPQTEGMLAHYRQLKQKK